MKVELSWEKPEFNSALLDHYLLYIYEMEAGSEKPDLDTQLRVETINRRAKVTLLEPGTRKFAFPDFLWQKLNEMVNFSIPGYLAQVIALGIAGENRSNGNGRGENNNSNNDGDEENGIDDDRARSLPSKLQFKVCRQSKNMHIFRRFQPWVHFPNTQMRWI